MAEDQMQMLEVMVTYLPSCTPFESQRLRRLLRQSLCFPQVIWWAKVVSNHRPPACKAGALPLSYSPETPLCGW